MCGWICVKVWLFLKDPKVSFIGLLLWLLCPGAYILLMDLKSCVLTLWMMYGLLDLFLYFFLKKPSCRVWLNCIINVILIWGYCWGSSYRVLGTREDLVVGRFRSCSWCWCWGCWWWWSGWRVGWGLVLSLRRVLFFIVFRDECSLILFLLINIESRINLSSLGRIKLYGTFVIKI